MRVCPRCHGWFRAKTALQRHCSRGCAWPGSRPGARKQNPPGYTTAAGYGYSHQQIREALRPEVEAGIWNCQSQICVMPERRIRPGQEWDLGHTPDRAGYEGPEHARCNRVDGNRRRWTGL
jgi:hypothetical protein